MSKLIIFVGERIGPGPKDQIRASGADPAWATRCVQFDVSEAVIAADESFRLAVRFASGSDVGETGVLGFPCPPGRLPIVGRMNSDVQTPRTGFSLPTTLYYLVGFAKPGSLEAAPEAALESPQSLWKWQHETHPA